MKKVIVLLVMVCLGTALLIMTSVDAKATKNVNVVGDGENGVDLYEHATIHLDADHYAVNEEITLIAYTQVNSSIESVTFEGEGFQLISDFLITNKQIVFTVLYDKTVINANLRIDIETKAGTVVIATVYGVVFDEMIFLDSYSYAEAERTYMYYLENTDSQKYYNLLYDRASSNEVSNSIVVSAENKSADVTNSNNTKSYVSGMFQWRDEFFGELHPLQGILVELYDRVGSDGPISLIEYTYTDENGEYSFEFENTSESDGFDVIVRIMPVGRDFVVKRSNGSDYYDDLGYYENLPIGNSPHIVSRVYEMVDENGNNDMFAQALQISQAIVIAAEYYESMIGEDSADVQVVYPHDEERQNCFYRNELNTIYILGPTLPSLSEDDYEDELKLDTYSSWDVIMHEYGHHIEHHEGITASLGGGHTGNDMIEHYASHFKEGSSFSCDVNCILKSNPSRFPETECKEHGMALAWAEGFATYFSIAAQMQMAEEYTHLNSVYTVGDGSYTTYGNTHANLESCGQSTEGCELMVANVLYDIIDEYNSAEPEDLLSISQERLWNYIVSSEAKNYDAFDDCFCSAITNEEFKAYCRILRNGSVVPLVRTDPLDTLIAPTINVIRYDNYSNYVQDIKYQLHFYNSNLTLIAQTELFLPRESSKMADYTISEELWETLLNLQTNIYVTITIYDNNSPATEYEGGWTQLPMPTIPRLYYDGTASGTLDVGECYWYKFVCPLDGTYVFSTTGTTDTYGEVFSSIVTGTSTENILAYDDDSGEGSNFSISLAMTMGEMVYIRVSGAQWERTGDFTFAISCPTHTHSYTNSYSYHTSYGLQHKAYCACGASTMQPHSMVTTATGAKCSKCRYTTTGLVERDEIPGIGEDIILYIDTGKDDEI